MALLKQLLGSTPEIPMRDFVGSDGQFDCEMMPARFRGDLTGLQLEKARTAVAHFMSPASGHAIRHAVAAMMNATKQRERTAADLAIYVNTLEEDLADFPGDVVIEALRRIRRQETFTPALAEIIDKCHWLARRRRSLAEGLGMAVSWRQDR